MNIRSIVAGIAFFILSPIHAGPILNLSGAPLQVNQCPITETNYALDLALTHSGYFVVSRGKNSEYLYTRFGRLALNADGFIVTDSNHYLLKINKKSDYNRLSKIKISDKNLPPKATEQVKIEVNLSANALQDDFYNTDTRIYDSLAGEHILTIKFIKTAINTWNVQAFDKEVHLGTGKVFFNNKGTLIRQEGLTHIQWPVSYGMNELKIDLKNSTQYASPYTMMLFQQDGYGLGRLSGLEVSVHGEILLTYTNGQIKQLNGRIAVAKFSNPIYLDLLMNHLYKPNDKSGNPMIHWLNGEYSVLSGVYEEEPCLS